MEAHTELKQQFGEQTVQDFDWTQKVFTKFADDDDDSLDVSIYTAEGDNIVNEVAAVLREYGFTQFGEIDFAPGSSVFSFKTRFGKKDVAAARRNKAELKRDLLKRRPSVHPVYLTKSSKRASAIAKLWKKVKKAGVYVLIGNVLLWGGKKVGEVVTEELIKSETPAIVRTIDDVVVRESPPGPAATGGESGIRTHVTLSSKHAFQACAFSHSAISPAPCEAIVLILTVLRIARELQIPHFIRDDNSGDSLLLLA